MYMECQKEKAGSVYAETCVNINNIHRVLWPVEKRGNITQNFHTSVQSGKIYNDQFS